jgi:hypothetical protein
VQYTWSCEKTLNLEPFCIQESCFGYEVCENEVSIQCFTVSWILDTNSIFTWLINCGNYKSYIICFAQFPPSSGSGIYLKMVHSLSDNSTDFVVQVWSSTDLCQLFILNKMHSRSSHIWTAKMVLWTIRNITNYEDDTGCHVPGFCHKYRAQVWAGMGRKQMNTKSQS